MNINRQRNAKSHGMSKPLAQYVDAVEGLASNDSPHIVQLTDAEISIARAAFAECKGTTATAEAITQARKAAQ